MAPSPGNPLRSAAAYSVHALTASGAVVGLFALEAIYAQAHLKAMWLMAAAVSIDAIDGWLARRTGTTRYAAKIDGALLDNLVDFVNYAIVPACFLMNSALLSEALRPWLSSAIVLAAAYQFAQHEAKTVDHFFKGFPSYWNIVVFYLFVWETRPAVNAVLIAFLILLTFVPVKYVYPSRPEHLSRGWILPAATIAATLGWGAATLGLLWFYPARSPLLTVISAGYVATYFAFSLFRTLVPAR